MPNLKAFPSSDRPRERMMAHGPAGLSDSELIAVLLGSGNRTQNVVDMAGNLLETYGGLNGLGRAAGTALAGFDGVGPARACALGAAFELGRRATGHRPRLGQRLGQASDVWTHLRARLCDKPIEEFWALGLDVRHRVRFESCLARGCLTGVEVHPRDVFRVLIEQGVAAVIFCHNHPSGEPTPSREDLDLTQRLREVGQLCGISVLDHVVVAQDGFVSIAERGWI